MQAAGVFFAISDELKIVKFALVGEVEALLAPNILGTIFVVVLTNFKLTLFGSLKDIRVSLLKLFLVELNRRTFELKR